MNIGNQEYKLIYLIIKMKQDLKAEIVEKMNTLFPFVGSDIKKEPYPYGELTDVGLPELLQLGEKLV